MKTVKLSACAPGSYLQQVKVKVKVKVRLSEVERILLSGSYLQQVKVQVQVQVRFRLG